MPDLLVSAIVVAVGEGNRRTVASNRTRHTPSAQLGSWTHGEAIIGLMNQLFERLNVSSAYGLPDGPPLYHRSLQFCQTDPDAF